MTPDPRPDVRSIFGRALELPDPVRRAAFLDEACAAAPAVRSWSNDSQVLVEPPVIWMPNTVWA